MTTTRPDTDACTFLDNDHKAVKKLFKTYDELMHSRARDVEQKKLELAREICQELMAHATIEEEIFYPALRAAMQETSALAEAEVEHAGAKDLIAQIEAMETPDEMFDAKVKVLGEYIDHHIKEERNQIFPKARSVRALDLIAMREELQARKEALLEMNEA